MFLVSSGLVLHIVGMSLDRYTQTANIKAAERRRVLIELKQLAADIGRCQTTITAVMAELNAANAKYSGLRSTRQEVEYLTVILACAKKKLAWEKQIASLQKRAPALLESMSGFMNDKDYPMTEEMQAEMLGSLQTVQGALALLQVPGVEPEAEGGTEAQTPPTEQPG